MSDGTQFPREKLTVYQKALEFFERIQRHLSSWGRRHAFADHLWRASESVVFNLVEAVRLRQTEKKLLAADYAIGSVMECAACLDIAVLKQRIEKVAANELKSGLLEVCKMSVGLRNSWSASHVEEVSADYVVNREASAQPPVFYHETLDRYIVALEFYRWLISLPPPRRHHAAFEKQADTLATRMVLNIAEGNGRYAALSRQTFLDTANAACAKLAALMDMGVRRGLLDSAQVDRGKSLLVRVGQMTARREYSDS